MGTQKTSNRAYSSRLLNRHVLFGLAATLALSANTYGYIVAVDGAVTADMGAGGTQANPAQYIIGAGGAYNAHFSGDLYVGGDTPSSSSWNQLLIKNGSTVTVDGLFAVGMYDGTNNSVVISGGSTLYSNTFGVVGNLVGASAANNSLLVTGAGSRYEVNGTHFLTNNGSWLQASNGGLINFNNSSFMALPPSGNPTDPIRLDGGFCAWQGQNEYDLAALTQSFQYWDSQMQSWLYASGDNFSDHIQITYYETDEEGYAATGHWGLGGHSVASAIPEPSTYATIFGLAMAGVALIRHRKNQR